MRFDELVLRDTRANQPAASDDNLGAIYYVTDEEVTERSNGTTWEDISDAGTGVSDADDVTYTPTTLADWDGGSDPGDVEQALDQLAERVTDLEGAGPGGGDAWYIVLRPLSNEPPSASYATLDLRNSHPVLDFDGSADEEAVWTSILPDGYAGGGLTVETFWALTSATSGSFRVQAGIERIDLSSLDIDSDSFAAFQSAGGTAPGTTGQVVQVDVAFTDGAQMDSLAAGELFRLKIRRDADGTSGTDDITTDAELLAVRIRET